MNSPGEVKTQEITVDGQQMLQVTINGCQARLPFKQLGDKTVAFLDISGRFQFIELCADCLVAKLVAAQARFDTIFNPVSKSNALAHAIAVRWAKQVDPAMDHTVVARKSAAAAGKNQASYRSVTTPAEQTLSLTPDDAAFMRGKRVLMVDDVFGGGGTFKALQTLADQAGAIVAAKAVIAVEGSMQNAGDVISLFALPVK